MPAINRFTQHRISGVLEAIACDEHTVDSVKSLIIDIRSASPKRSIVREFGDFIAHPDERDRGLVHTNIDKTFQGMVRFFRASKGLPIDGPPRFEVKPSFTGNDIIDELLSLIVSLGILSTTDSRWFRIQGQRDSILVCLLSLIQGAVFKIGGYRLPGFVSCLRPESNDENEVALIPIAENVGLIDFNAVVPSELLTGDKYINLVFPVILTHLRGSDWLTGDLSELNSGRCFFEAIRGEKGIRLNAIGIVDIDR